MSLLATKDLPLNQPELKRQSAYVASTSASAASAAPTESLSLSETKVNPLDELYDGVKTPVCFVSNFGLSKINLNVKGMEPCYEYGQGFVNRSPTDLLALDYYNIWIDCSVKDARKWFNKNSALLKKAGFKVYCIWYGRGVENSTWLEKMKQFGCSIICNISDFKKVLTGAISAEDVFNGLESLALQVDAPPITACCGMISLFRKKKPEEESST